MQTGVTAKAGAAFLAGMFVALGGAAIYLKAVDHRSSQSVQSAALGEPGSTVPDLSAPPPKPPADVSPPSTPPPAPTAEKQEKDASDQPNKAAVPVKTHSHSKTTRRPVSLAVSHPKAPLIASNTIPDSPFSNPPLTQTESAPVPRTELGSVTAPPPIVNTAPQPHTVTIPAGTSIAVRLTEKLSTDHNFNGDTFRATLDTPIITDGFIIADKGAKVLGRIVKAQKPGRFDGFAELQLTLTEISTTDGQQMQVQTNDSLRKGPSNANQEILKMGGGAALGAIIGAIAGGGKGAAIGAGAGGAAGTGAVLLGHGKPAVIDYESRLIFTLSSATTLTEKLN